jgi:hypothetical protein
LIADPTKDLDENLRRGDGRFVGIYGYACSPLGSMKAEWEAICRLTESYEGTRVACIEGISDVLSHDHQYLDPIEPRGNMWGPKTTNFFVVHAADWSIRA